MSLRAPHVAWSPLSQEPALAIVTYAACSRPRSPAAVIKRFEEGQGQRPTNAVRPRPVLHPLSRRQAFGGRTSVTHHALLRS